MDDPSRTAPITAHLAPELRRSAVIAVVGLLVVLVAGSLVGPAAMGVTRRVLGFVVWGIAASGLLGTAFSFRMEVDADGLRRRRLFLVDGWTRDAFRSGAIRRLSGTRFHDPTRPWWRRTLSLGLLDNPSSEAICERLRDWIPQASAASLPRELVVALGKREFRFEPSGIRYSRGPHDVAALHRWSEIGCLTLTRDRHDTVALSRLSFRLAGVPREVRLFHYKERPVWRGPDAETLARFIETHVPAEYLLVIASGPPRSERERAFRLARCDRTIRKTRRLLFVGAPCLFLVILVLFSSTPPAGAPLPLGWAFGALLGTLYLTPFVAVLYDGLRRARAARAELLAPVASAPRADRDSDG